MVATGGLLAYIEGCLRCLPPQYALESLLPCFTVRGRVDAVCDALAEFHTLTPSGTQVGYAIHDLADGIK